MTEPNSSPAPLPVPEAPCPTGRDTFSGEVDELRRAAAERAHVRPRIPFSGRVQDEVVGCVPVRRYVPRSRHADAVAVFLHGGYGVFGDLDLQDAWCRRLASRWGVAVISVDYPLAPEHTLTESVNAVAEVCTALGAGRLIVCGDSAGAALALAATACGAASVDGLVLTNPNIDLTLARFDESADAGPDPSLSRAAFARWTHGWTHSRDFVTCADVLPPTFVATGRHDAVLTESRDLAAALRSHGQRAELAEYDAGHGFLGETAVSDDVLVRARRFFQL